MKIMITGASGLVGQRLKHLLAEQGHQTVQLGRPKKESNNAKKDAFSWNPETMQMEEGALAGVDAIIHLAGAGVADKPWTKARKQEILQSRVQSTLLLYQELAKGGHQVKVVVSASAVGYYGDAGEDPVEENYPGANTFLAGVCKDWEAAVDRINELGIRTVKLRIGIVMAKDGGALPELSKSLRFGVGAYFSKTPLYYPWIHIDDVCSMFMYACTNRQLNGAYNCCAPDPVPVKVLMEEIIAAGHYRALLIPAPAFGLRLAMGEMADMLLSSQRCSVRKIISTGYSFKYPGLKEALKNLMSE